MGKYQLSLISVFALLLGVLFDYLFYGKSLGVSFFVFVAILISLSLIVAKKLGKRFTRDQWFLVLGALVLSGTVFVRASSFLTFFNVWGSIYLVLLFFFLFLEHPLSSFPVLKYLVAPFSFVKGSFLSGARSLEQLLGILRDKKRFGSSEFQSVVKGVVLAFPILLLFVWLFYSADLVVQHFIERFVDIDIDSEIGLRLLIVLVVSYFSLGFFSRIGRTKEEGTSVSKTENKALGFIEGSTVLVLVELLFGAFLMVQFFYLFGGQQYVWGIPENLTYAEYARRGFGELTLVSLLSFLLLYGLEKFNKRATLKQERAFQILSGILTLEVFVIMFSAWQRLSLYIDAYGFTFMRLLALFLLVWIFVVFLLFLARVVLRKSEGTFLASLFWLTLAWWIAFNWLNPDAFAVRKNIERYGEGKKFDIEYYRPSEDAIPELVKVFHLQEGETLQKAKENLAMDLYWQYAHPWEDENQSFSEALAKQKEKQVWRSFHIAKHSALGVLQENARVIEKYQAEYWKRQEQECKESLQKCEEACEEIPEESSREKNQCLRKECSYEWLQSNCVGLEEKASGM